MSDMECPYCTLEIDTCDWNPNDYKDSEHNIYTCPSCNKGFIFDVCFSVDYFAGMADCLNGSPHDLKVCPSPKVVPNSDLGMLASFACIKCSTCGYSRFPKDEEKEKILKGEDFVPHHNQ